MPEMNQTEKKLSQRITDERLRTSLALIRQAAAAIWAVDAPRIIQDYTDHGLEHSQRLAGLAAKLLAANDGLALTSEEMYLLLAGIYLHDIGMQCDVPRFPEIKTAAEALGARFDIEFIAPAASSYTVDEQKAIRKNHQYLSAAWIDVANRTGQTALGIAAKTIPEDLAEDLMDVCKHHAKVPITDCPAGFRFDSTGRKQLVAALLRFADELDVDGHRVSIETVKNFRLDPGNAIYWWLHNRTKVVFGARNVVTLTVRLHPDDAKRLGAIVHAAFIDEFRTKNHAVLTVLARHSIPIIISSESKVIADNRADPLPQEIAEALLARSDHGASVAPGETSAATQPASATSTATGSVSEIKRKSLEQRRADLLEEYAAVNAQVAYALSEVDRLRLHRQAEAIERELASLEESLSAILSVTSPADSRKNPQAVPPIPPRQKAQEQRRIDAAAPIGVPSRQDSGGSDTGQYADLRHGLANGEVCAFVGAGLSIGAGLPDWYDLIAELAARIGHKLVPREWAEGDALINVTQAYVNRQGLHSLISHVKDQLDTTGKQPTAAHRALARMPISLVFTANFDDLLERAFRDAGKRVEVVVKDSSIPFMRRRPDTVNIVKLYGDLDQPDTIVLARQQYESYFLQRPQMVKLLEVELARSDMLYLGWSGSDPYFKLVFGDLLSRFGQMMRPGYAVMFDVADDQRDELRRKQIRLIELPVGDRTEQLASWLTDLGEE